jgi:uncharacterized protein YhaN
MRLNQLSLLRYGKFTDKQVDFPKEDRDFHLVLGPNEAGKSTLRQAISDVLFGIENRTPLSFLHPKSELRLGAVLHKGDSVLRFERAKALRNTLRDEHDVVLSDQILTPFLDGVSLTLFKKMFSLDHDRLLEGGQDMLAAKDDLGQVLFQAASGIAGLGKLYEGLKAEANQLWSSRRAKDRQWYDAVDQLEHAADTLKQVTVRTMQWRDADQRLQELEQALMSVRERHRSLSSRRGKLERIRRWAPIMGRLKDLERSMADLGDVTLLPVDAGAMQEQASTAMAQATQRLVTHRAERLRIEESLRALPIDDALLLASADIESLEAMRHRCAQQQASLARYQTQAALAWQEIKEIVQALPWADEVSDLFDASAAGQSSMPIQALRRRLPTLPVRKQLEQLMRQRVDLDSALNLAKRSLQTRESEVDSLQVALSGLKAVDVTPSLRDAVRAISKWDDPDMALRKAQDLCVNLQEQLERAIAALAEPGLQVQTLATTVWPSSATISTLQNERQTLLAQQQTASLRLSEVQAAVDEMALELEQYKLAHRVADQRAVIDARIARDQQWQDIEVGKESPAQAGPSFRRRIVLADELVDLQLASAQDVADLQNREHALAREKLTLAHQERQQNAADLALAQFDANWARMLGQWGLSERPLIMMQDWLFHKDKVLAVARELKQARDEQSSLQSEMDEWRSMLSGALRLESIAVSDQVFLKEVRGQAMLLIQNSDASAHRHAAISEQLTQARAAVGVLRREQQESLAHLEAWQGQWRGALADLGLGDVQSIVQVNAILDLMSQLGGKLDKVREIQDEQLAIIHQDLSRFDAAAQELALRLDPASVSNEDAAALSRNLSTRLMQVRDLDAQRRQLRQDLQHVTEQERVAREEADVANASLQPLFARSGTSDIAVLIQIIARSQAYRRNQTDQEALRTELLDGGHGYSLAQIQEDVASVDHSALSADMDQLEVDLDLAVQELNRLSVEKADADRILAGMHGADAAARAEGQRQEALARMAEIAGRYIKVQTAARLLRWTMDRYREEKQGPMLQGAGELFRRLTLDSFQRLVVDFEQEPLVLEGLRSSGERLGIEAMSEGTRDQLFLALRLAALDMHVGQGNAMPFIADDLFVNYDDSRTLAGLQILADISSKTQVIFLSHHAHIEPLAQSVFGRALNVIRL